MKALFGTFNIDMLPIATVDDSDKIGTYIKDDIIEIPKDLVFREAFGNVGGAAKNYLQISTPDKVYNIMEDQYVENIEIKTGHTENKIKIIYFFFTSPNSNWRAILSGQLYQLKSLGILSEADLYIHITDCHNYTREIKEIIQQIVPLAIVSVSSINQFEYPGLKLTHDLALQHPDSTFIYCHSKGMTHNQHSRSLEETVLFTRTFENWRKNIQLLDKENKQKAGLFSSGEGWVWYNFWYAKGAYLAQCSPPKITDNRYYYESWLGKANKNPAMNDCVNLFEIKKVNKMYYTSAEAHIYKENLIEWFFSPAKRKDLRVLKSPRLIYEELKVKSFFIPPRQDEKGE